MHPCPATKMKSPATIAGGYGPTGFGAFSVTMAFLKGSSKSFLRIGGRNHEGVRRKRFILVIVPPVAHHFDNHGYRQNEDGVRLVIFDLDPVGITQPEPLPRDRCDFFLAAVYDVLEVEKISDCFEIVGTGHIDHEAVAPEGETIAPDIRRDLA